MRNQRRKGVFLHVSILVASSQLSYLLLCHKAKSRNFIFALARERAITRAPNKMMSNTFIVACLLIFTHLQRNHIINTQRYSLLHHNRKGRAFLFLDFISDLFLNEWIHFYLSSWKKTNGTECSFFFYPIKRNVIIFKTLSLILGVFSKKNWSFRVRRSLYVQKYLRDNTFHFTLNFVPFSRCYY